MEIIVRKYDGPNRALGKYIRGKHHYNEEMKRQGMVSKEKGDEMARKAEESMKKPYKVSNDTLGFIRDAKMHSKNGKLKLSDREIDFMKKKGVNFNHPGDMGTEGGFK